MFTLVICVVVVALSAAAVLHITLVDHTKVATPRHRPRRHRAAPAPPGPPQRPPAPTASAPAAPGTPVAQPRRGPAPASLVIEVHRARSAGLLLVLLTVLGGVLAVAVAAVAVAAVRALRAALVG